MARAKKYVYSFGSKKTEGKAEMKNLLGGKGANLAEMSLLGIPVLDHVVVGRGAYVSLAEVLPLRSA